jgi:hypothetical protein
VLGHGLLVAGWFFVAAQSLVSGVGGQVLEFHGGGRVARGNTEVGANVWYLLLVSSRAPPERWRRSLQSCKSCWVMETSSVGEGGGVWEKSLTLP